MQIGAKKCKWAQIQKTLPLNPKGLLTHVCLCLFEHPDTICREKCKPGLVKPVTPRADFSKTSTVSFTSVNLGFRAETQRHVNLRYFGGPRMHSGGLSEKVLSTNEEDAKYIAMWPSKIEDLTIE